MDVGVDKALEGAAAVAGERGGAAAVAGEGGGTAAASCPGCAAGRRRFYEISDPSEALAALEDELLAAAAMATYNPAEPGRPGSWGGGGAGGGEGLDSLCAMLGELLERECTMHALAAAVSARGT